MKLGTFMLHRGLQLVIVCSNDDPGMTLTYFTVRLILENIGFYMEKSENNGFFWKLLQPEF